MTKIVDAFVRELRIASPENIQLVCNRRNARPALSL